MIYGRIGRPLPVALIFFALAALFTAQPAYTRPALASDLTVTLLSVSPGAFQVQGADGRAFTVKITPATWVLRRGLVVAPHEMTPGETLRVRLGRGAGGTALLICDAETAEAIETHRRRPLSCTVVSAADKVWTVQPADGQTPLPVCLSAHTTFRAGGSVVSASAFGMGAQVLITTRGLANGLLAAVSVSNAVPAAPDPPGQAAESQTPRSVAGVLVEARPDLGLLTITDTAGVARTVAVDVATRVKSAGRAASLGDMTPGMRVRVRLGTGQDAAGNPVATSLSASDPKPSTPKKKRR